jgi:curli biogenesis system outer membrane secretion channel CsgG
MLRTLIIFLLLALAISTSANAQQNRPSVGVFQMEDLANTGQAATFSTMIETSIASTNRFRVIERERLGRLLGEQGRARAGVVTSRNRGRVGGFEGVDYLIYGTITSIQASAREGFGEAIVGGLISGLQGRNGNTHCSNQAATLAIDIRITDSSTGEIRNASRISETQRVAMVCNGQSNIDVPLLLRAAAERIAGTLVTAIYPIQIAAMQPDGTFILNYGDGTIQPGAILAVYSRGQPIRDPTTGQVIGNDETKLGLIRVNDVTGRMSRAMAVAPFMVAPQVGAIVRPASAEDVRAASHPPRRGNNSSSERRNSDQ